ncbi:cytochrome c oxidase subunit II [Sphingomonas sp. URHD0057]|uniref:cytochrome c oxidase subunit II n=1 Tax=Sphingomonas sp. URHD0057 TaxID=1380389 RepID=UPI00048D1B6F|nr:c-type cytochrome [Sphingomonas sp. URHD0057]
MTRRGLSVGGVLAPCLMGCSGIQTALGGSGADDASFVRLFAIFLGVCAVMYVLVIAALGGALANRRGLRTVDNGAHHESAPWLRSALIGWIVLIGLGLIGLTLASFFADRSAAARAKTAQFTVKIVANQWWWDVIYMTPDVSQIVHTANELHLPVGVEAEVQLESNDVIHSFWVPNLAGKQDLIPGRMTDIQLLPQKIGLYRAQCAEFCGIQHANMALVVTVESKPDFLRWMAQQRRPAFAPTTPLELAGYRYFTTRECSSCHNVAGTPASGQIGPDLTHLASRRTLAAGALPMSSGNLYGWVADPQSQKPGNKMPTIGLAPNDLHAVVAYLERLK